MSGITKKMVIAGAALLFAGTTAFGAVIVGERHIEKEIAKRLNKILNASAFVADIKYQEIDVSLLRQELVIRGITADSMHFPGHLKVAQIKLGGFNSGYIYKAATGDLDPQLDLPETSLIEVTGVELPLEDLGVEQVEPLLQMGYKALRMSFSHQTNYDSVSEVFTYRTAARLEDMGEISFMFELGDFEMDGFVEGLKGYQQTTDPTAFSALAMTTLTKLGFRYNDLSLISRINHLAYEREKTTLGHSFKKHRRATQRDRSPAAQWDEKMLDVIQSFLDNPKSLSVVAAPQSPVPVAKMVSTSIMGGPEAIVELLKVKVIANK